MSYRLEPWVALLAVVACGCTQAAIQPTAAPARDDLAAYLQNSPAVRAIAAAAAGEGLLSSADPDIDDLETAAEALGIETVAQLDVHVRGVVDDSAVLFAAFDRRRRGSRRGDTAHWVAVALLALDPETPAEQHFRTHIDWEPDYIDDVFVLRRIAAGNDLAQAALGDSEPQPVAYDVTIAPQVDPQQPPTVEARETTEFWPVFAQPGSRRIGGAVGIVRGELIEWDDLRVLVRRAGTIRVLAAPAEPLPRFRLADDGAMTADGATRITTGQRLNLLVSLPGRVNLALVEPGIAVGLPWDLLCCQVEERPDAEWWVRLAGGPIPGAWINASADAFRIRHPAFEARLRADREARPRRTRVRTGRLANRGTLPVAGAELIYWLEGSDADAPPALVLHGGPGIGSRYLRAPLTAALGDRRILVFYDQRGSGYSEGADTPAELTIDRFVADIDAVRTAAVVDRIDIVGHSFGGLLALHYALAHPERVDRLVLIDPDPPSRELWETFRQRVASRTTLEDAATMAEIVAGPGWGTDPDATEAWFAIRMRAYVADPESTPYIDLPFDEMTLRNYSVTSPAVRADLGDWDLRERLANLTTPTLIVAGGDSIFPPEAMRALAEALPNSRLAFLDDTGHFPFVEAPGAFRELVVSFLER